MRRVTLFASAILMALFVTLAAHTASVEAQTTDDAMATWTGDNLQYGDTSFTRSDSPETDENVPGLINTPCEDNQNVYYSSDGTRDDDDEYYWMYVICLTADFEGDRSESTPARLLEYRVPRDDHELGADNARNFNEHGEFQGFAISVAPEGTDASGNPIDESTEPTTTCDSTNTYGLGWVICPATRFLSAAMDQLFNILVGFFTVAPLTNDTDSTLYTMWNLVRNLANILFIIGFLFIIYSQITSFGISNYGIKRLLPRLFIAAILVNLSYWICALAVDLSNILGVYIKTLFEGVVDSVELEGNVEFKAITWQSLAGAALTGGLGAVAIGGAIFSLAASAGASIWFLLVTLMGVLVSALIAIIVLAARQALITVLVIISPLAFVAYLLPSTEKYFDRWRDIFTTLLLVFPIFSLIFGGSQLAGLIIIASALENTDSLNFFNLIILGMVVQVAPVVVTPLLIRFSGSLLGRIAGMVNDPNKGLIDRTRNFAQSRHDMTKNRRLWDWDKENGRFRNNDPLAALGRRKALRDEHDASKLKSWQSGAHTAYTQDHRYHESHTQQAINEMRQKAGEDEAKAEFARDRRDIETLRVIDTQQRISKEVAETEENKTKSAYDAIRTRPGIAPAAIRNLADQAHQAHTDALDETQRQSSMQIELDNVYWQDLASDADRQAYAGAAGIAEHGETRVANIARQKQTEEREKRVNAAISNLSTAEAKLAEERAVILGDAANAGQFASLAEDLDSRSGALRRYIGRAPIEHIQTLLEELDITMSANGDTNAEVLRSELAGALQKRKPFYISQTRLNQIEEGTLGTQYKGPAGKELLIGEALNARALGAQTMVTADRDDLKATVQYLKGGGTLSTAAKTELERELRTAFTDSRYRSQMDKRINELTDLWGELGMGTPP